MTTTNRILGLLSFVLLALGYWLDSMQFVVGVSIIVLGLSDLVLLLLRIVLLNRMRKQDAINRFWGYLSVSLIVAGAVFWMKQLEGASIMLVFGTAILLFQFLPFFFLLKFKNEKATELEQERNAELKNKLEQVQLEKKLAEESQKFKQQFLAHMSHEIRTPMNAVMGMTNLLIDKNPRSDQLNYLDGIKKSSVNLLHILNDILDLSKIESGKIELEQIDFSIRDVIDQVKQTLQYITKEKGLELLVHIDEAIPDVSLGDPTRLNQVLINLAGNALKFTEKGSITLSVIARSEATKQSPTNIENAESSHVSHLTSQVSRLESPVSPLTFHITDTGIGIPKEKLQTIFESFSQAHSSDTRRFGGTGLGLTISKQLVELMGGKISVESKEGSGTTFSFEINLPIGSAERLTHQKSAGEIDGSILNGLRILLAEDNEYNRIVAMDTLKSKSKVEIDSAMNGREAIELFTQNDYDVILMDVQMPELDGYEATRKIRKEFSSPKNKIPIIALTASVIRSDLDKCISAGMSGYVPKPFNASELISAIAEVTGRAGRMQPATINNSLLTINNSPLTINGPKNFSVEKETEETASVVDLAFLRNFCENDKVRMSKYIQLYLNFIPEQVEKLELAFAEKNFDRIRAIAHSLRAQFNHMGMSNSSRIAGSMELEAYQENNFEKLTLMFSILKNDAQRSVTELQYILNN